MKRKAVMFTLALSFLLLLSGLAGVPTAASPAEGDGSREGRSTPIDGYHEDEFHNTNNLTLWDDVAIIDGQLMVDRSLSRDEFDRLQLAPWQAEEGSPRIIQQVLYSNATETSNASASMSLDRHDLEIQLDFSPGLMNTGGPIIKLSTQGPDVLWGTYNGPSNEIQLWLTNSTGDHVLSASSALLTQDEWYSALFMVEDTQISLGMGPFHVSASKLISGTFSKLTLGSALMDSAAWDNVTVNKLGGSGTALTHNVMLPEDTYWTSLNLYFFRDPSTDLELAIIDPSTGQPYPGLNDITNSYLSLEDKLDPLEDTAIQLRIKMTAVGTATPKVYSWKVSWEGDPPLFIKPLPPVTLDEDEDQEGVLDLRKYFDDKFTDGDNLTFTISWMSASQHVMPVVDGYMLGFQLPTENWYGTEYYKVSCSDGVLSAEAYQATVTVKPVDDTPIVSPLDKVDMYEDEEFSFDISPYLADIDTPVEVLMVRALSDHATVVGQVINLNYDKAGKDRIELEVSDYSSYVQVFLDVTIREVDDAPVFEPMGLVVMYEDEVETVDLMDYLSDEDDLIDDLLIDLEDADEYISLEGATVTLFYGDTGGVFEYTILVSDEHSTVSQVLKVEVQEVNDLPIIASVGGMVPEEGKLAMTMTEGNTTNLPVVVEDEESSNFIFTLVSDLDTAEIVGNNLRITTTVGDMGAYTLSILVSDGAAAASVRIALEVINQNDPMQDVAVAAPEEGASFVLGTLVTLKGYAFDPDTAYGQVLYYTWTSSLDGDLGTGKNLDGVNLTKGGHTITLVVSDGEFTAEATVNVTITTKGGGGGGDDGNGGGDAGAFPTMMVVGIVAALVIVGALFFVMRGRSEAPPEAPPTEPEPIPSAAAAYDRPAAKAEPAPADEPTPVAEPAPEPEKAVVVPVDDATSVDSPDYEPEPEPAPDAEPEPEPLPSPAPVEQPVVEMTGIQGVAYDTTSFYETDPEKQRLDELKRKYQTTISTLPFGVPSKELAHMDWHEVAAAMATGEHKELEDGRPVTKIGEHWYYSDTEDVKTFLKRHE